MHFLFTIFPCISFGVQDLDRLEKKLEYALEQRSQWTRLSNILEIKTRCHEDLDLNGFEGSLKITHNAETLTLNN